MKNILIIFVFVGFISCSNTNNFFQYPEIIKLSYIPLITDEKLVLKPLTFEVFDNIFIVWDPYEEFHFTVIDAKKNTLLFRGGRKGQGPDEFLYPVILDKVSDSILQIVDCAARKVSLLNVSDVLKTNSFKAYKTINYSDISLKDGEFIDFLYYINDDTLVGVGYFHTSKYIFYQIDSNNIEYIFDLPEDKRHYHKREPKITKYTAYQGVLHFNPARNTILYHSPMSFYFEVFESVQPSEMLFTHFEPINYIIDDFGRAAIHPNNKSGIIWGDLSDSKIYLLYSGRSKTEYGADAFLSDQMFVLTHHGEKLVKYHLMRDVFSFVLDEKQQKIYAIVFNPETEQFEIGYFPI